MMASRSVYIVRHPRGKYKAVYPSLLLEMATPEICWLIEAVIYTQESTHTVSPNTSRRFARRVSNACLVGKPHVVRQRMGAIIYGRMITANQDSEHTFEIDRRI